MAMELIEAYEVSSDTATVTLSSIPQTYTDLYILVSGRTSRAEKVDLIVARPNGSTTNMASVILIAADTAPFSGTDTAVFVYTTGATATTDTFGNGAFYFSNYTSSANKSVSTDSTYENNNSSNFQGIVAGLWSNSAAITSFDFVSYYGANIKAGSTIYIYGIS